MTGPRGERWEALGPLGTAALVAFPNTRDEEGGAGSFRSAAAGTAAAHRTSTPPDRGDRPPPPAPCPRGLDAGGASPQNKEGASGRRSPAHPRPRTSGGSGVRGEAVSLRRAGGAVAAAWAFVAVTRCHQFPLGAASGKARAVSARSGTTRSSAGQPDPDPVAPAGQSGPDTSPAAMPSDGRRCQGVRVRRPGPGLSLSKPRTPNKSTARRASESHVPRGFRWERSRPVPPCSASSEFGAVLTPASGLSFGPKKSPAALAEGPWGRRGGPKPRQCWVLMGNARETTVVMVSWPRPASWRRLLRVALFTWLNSYFLLQD